MDVKRGLKGITAFHRAAMDELVDICVFFAGSLNIEALSLRSYI